MIDQLLAWIALYGVPAFFVILVVTSAGIPFPDTLMLLAVGSFVAQGEMKLWQVLVVGSVGAIVGIKSAIFWDVGAGVASCVGSRIRLAEATRSSEPKPSPGAGEVQVFSSAGGWWVRSVPGLI